MELHCSQTRNAHGESSERFEYPMELHCSQTGIVGGLLQFLFEYPMELHCSQTRSFGEYTFCCLSTLWNYTALKLGMLKGEQLIV